MLESRVLQEKNSNLKYGKYPGLLTASKASDLHIVGIKWTESIIKQILSYGFLINYVESELISSRIVATKFYSSQNRL
jgi:hypothetical protein